MLRKLSFLILIAAAFLAACASESAVPDNAESPSTRIDPVFENSQGRDAATPGGGGGGKTERSTTQISNDDLSKGITERKIIREASLSIESAAPREIQEKIVKIAAAHGGFVLESSVRESGREIRNQDRISVTLRVPSEKFEDALGDIRKTGGRILSETVKGQDVTEEFVDVEARLRAKKALEERFLEIMKRANTVKDALEVERELATVRTEVERIEGRKRSLINLTSLSKVSVTVAPPSTISASPDGFWYQFQDAVSDGFEGALTFVLVLVRILIAAIPFLLIVVLPLLLVLRYFWRKYKKSRLARAAAIDVEKSVDDVE